MTTDNRFVREDFVEWATLREAARRARQAGLPREQWSSDPIMQNYRFCNVSREDDRVTKDVKRLIRDPMTEAGADPLEVCKAVAIARFFNLTEALEELREKEAVTEVRCDIEAVFRVMTDRQSRGDNCFNTAYVVGCPPGQLVEPWLDIPGKIAYVCSIVKRATDGGYFNYEAPSRQAFVENLRKAAGFKDFMAGQVAADLFYTHVGADWKDSMTWAPRGPGAVRGINRCMGRPVDMPMSQETYLEMGMKALEMLPPDMVWDRKLTLHDVNSNVFCETDKFIRIKENPGRKVGRRYL